LAHSDPAQDPSGALIVAGASVSLVSEEGKRTVSVEDLSTDYYETSISNNEILTEVTIPVMNPDLRYAYYKYLPRTADDYATVAVCAVAAVEGGICSAIRLALGALGPTPIRAKVVEDMLLKKPINLKTTMKAADAVASIVSPLDDFRGTAEYKKDMAVVFTKKALQDVLA
jgi:CO/xanthine dehydrogenase FAD-binding subunit